MEAKITDLILISRSEVEAAIAELKKINNHPSVKIDNSYYLIGGKIVALENLLKYSTPAAPVVEAAFEAGDLYRFSWEHNAVIPPHKQEYLSTLKIQLP